MNTIIRVRAGSVVGGYVYRGTEFPELRGYYFVTDYYSGTVWILQRDGSGNVNLVNTQPGLKSGISSISETGDGTLYATALSESVVYKIISLEATPLTLLNFSGLAANGFNKRNKRSKWLLLYHNTRFAKRNIYHSTNQP